jgi:hypothetical protein
MRLSIWFESFLVIVISFAFFLLAFLKCERYYRVLFLRSAFVCFCRISLAKLLASPGDNVRELVSRVVWVVAPVFGSFFSVVANESILFPACFVNVFRFW